MYEDFATAASGKLISFSIQRLLLITGLFIYLFVRFFRAFAYLVIFASRFADNVTH